METLKRILPLLALAAAVAWFRPAPRPRFGNGHFPYLGTPERLNRTIGDFLGGERGGKT